MKYQNILNISLQQIQIFLKCFEYRNYSRIAEEYNFTPSMISKTIKNLEELLGLQLFVRKFHILEPIPAIPTILNIWKKSAINMVFPPFCPVSAATFENLANWPNADVPSMALVTGLIPELCGVLYDYVLRDDPVAMAETTLLVQEYLDVDTIIANLNIYNFEAEAMGAEVKFYPDHCADIVRGHYFIKGREDLGKIRFGGLDMGRFPYLIKYCEAYKKYTGADTFPMFSAPWTLAGNLYGVDNLVLDTVFGGCLCLCSCGNSGDRG